MSEGLATIAAPSPAPVAAPPVVEADAPFDRNAALDSMRAEFSDGEEEVTKAPENPGEEPVVEEPAKELSEEEKAEARKAKLKDKDGKIDQSKVDAAFAKLTAEGKRLRAKAEAFKAEKSQFETAKAEYDAAIEKASQRIIDEDKSREARRERAKTAPLGVLEELGWTVPKLITWIESDGQVDPAAVVDEKLSEFDKRLAEREAKLEERERAIKEGSFKNAAAQYEAKASKTIGELLPTYEFISKYDMTTEVVPKVLQNIAAIYREGGKLGDKTYPKGTALDPKTVLDHFEAHEARQLARFGIVPGQARATASVANPGAAQPKTLSNRDTSARSVVAKNDDDEPFNRDEAIRRAIAELG